MPDDILTAVHFAAGSKNWRELRIVEAGSAKRTFGLHSGSGTRPSSTNRALEPESHNPAAALAADVLRTSYRRSGRTGFQGHFPARNSGIGS